MSITCQHIHLTRVANPEQNTGPHPPYVCSECQQIFLTQLTPQHEPTAVYGVPKEAK